MFILEVKYLSKEVIILQCLQEVLHFQSHSIADNIRNDCFLELPSHKHFINNFITLWNYLMI